MSVFQSELNFPFFLVTLTHPEKIEFKPSASSIEHYGRFEGIRLCV